MKKNYLNNKSLQLTLILVMNLRLNTTLTLLLLLLVAGCAKQGMPTGGPKDVTPPVVRRMSPPNATLNSMTQDFYIEFDEYVVIKDAENNILVSPPMKEKPEFKTKGKGIKVTIKDSLQPNTTYLFQFKEAIADFNEGNLLPSLEYVFSTSDYIDSMMVEGKVVEALTMENDKDVVNVWLMDGERYRQAVNAMSDTNVKAPQPNYITRTNKNGLFCFNNIKPGRYHIVAVKDEDKNSIVGHTETMAFLDTTVSAIVMPSKDSTNQQINKSTNQHSLILRLSTPNTEQQRLTSSKFVSEGKVVLTSLLPLRSPHLDAGEERITWRLNSNRDTLTLWTLNKECDSLQLVVIDSTGINDTISLRWHVRKGQKNSPLSQPRKVKEMSISTSTLHYYDTLALLFTTPLDISRCRLDSVARIIRLKDSSIECCNAVMDSSTMKVMLPYRFQQGEKYGIEVDKECFTTIYGIGNDSLYSVITVTKAEEYGNLSLNISGDGDMIVELLNESGKVMQRKSVTGSNTVKFINLNPMKYRVRTILDSNGNGKWDVGDFATQLQPERVVYLDKTLEIRPNWDFEEEIKVNN